MIAAFGIVATVLLGLGTWLGGKSSPLLESQDPAGRGMFGGCVLVAFWAPGLVLAVTALIMAAMKPDRRALDVVFALCPVVLIGVIFVGYRVRRRRFQQVIDTAM